MGRDDRTHQQNKQIPGLDSVVCTCGWLPRHTVVSLRSRVCSRCRGWASRRLRISRAYRSVKSLTRLRASANVMNPLTRLPKMRAAFLRVSLDEADERSMWTMTVGQGLKIPWPLVAGLITLVRISSLWTSLRPLLGHMKRIVIDVLQVGSEQVLHPLLRVFPQDRAKSIAVVVHIDVEKVVRILRDCRVGGVDRIERVHKSRIELRFPETIDR